MRIKKMEVDAINFLNFGYPDEPKLHIDAKQNVSVFYKASFKEDEELRDLFVKVSEIKGCNNTYCLTVRNTLDDIVNVLREIKLYITPDHDLYAQYNKAFQAYYDIERTDIFGALVRVTLKRYTRALRHKLEHNNDLNLEKELEFLTR